MPAIINSDDGVSSGSSGLKTSGANDGLLNLQTNGSTAMSVNASQQVTFNNGANLPNTFGFKNRIINGGMVIDQRNAGVAITGGGFALDRFQTVLTGITSLVVASQQVTDAPSNSGFNYSYKYTVTTAATAYSTGGRTGILHRIEGYNSADFMFGTVNAKSVTFSFWVKSSVTGTYSVGFLNDDSSRAYPATYTVNSANTWEYKTITIAGCPDGTWLTTNGRGIQVEFCLGADTSRLGTANTWNSAFVVGATGTTLLSNTVGATFQVTGVQLEKGSTATSFDFRPYGTELMLCQRYYEKSYTQSTVPGTATQDGCFMTVRIDSIGSGTDRYKVTKRAAPTITTYSPEASNTTGARNYSTNANITTTVVGIGDTGFYFVPGSTSTGNGIGIHWVAAIEL
jgi:hypothetical protein